MTRQPQIILATLVAALLGACSSTPVAPPAAPVPVAVATPKVAVPTSPAANPNPTPESRVTTVSLPAYLDPKSDISSNRSVYFAFDDAGLPADAAGLIERQGKYLAANPKLAIKVEGNADERGSAEYNLALGQRRAEAVRQGLKIYGVKDGQMEAISWGKEKPKATGHDESAWAQNRRADLQYPKQ